MKKLIRKNTRRPFPYFEFIPHITFINRSFTISKRFKFTESAIYYFNDDDQFDVNKLFGFSVGMHHNNSFRFGWRPNKELNKIEIVGYEYHDKIRIPIIPICEVELNRWYTYSIKYSSSLKRVDYIVNDDFYNFFGSGDEINLKHKINFGYRLGLYFGGNKKAPHNMVIYRE